MRSFDEFRVLREVVAVHFYCLFDGRDMVLGAGVGFM